MQLTAKQFEQIADLLPHQRGNVSLSNLQVINALLYIADNGCKWRALPQRYGSWHTIYTRMMRWSRSGVLDHVFERLQRCPLMRVMDRACQDDATRELVQGMGFVPVVRPNRQRCQPWEYDKRLYRRRNQIERLFRKIKGWRRVFSGTFHQIPALIPSYLTVCNDTSWNNKKPAMPCGTRV